MIERYSSRRARLGSFLPERLAGARAYDRIAGYFSSSVIEVAGEALEQMAPGAVARVICNSSLNPLDVATARAAKQAMRREWCEGVPADVPPALRERLQRLFDFLVSGRLQVRVLPDACFGLIHGKAGVVTREDGSRFCFIGSANESQPGWQLNYELLWTDESAEGVDWVEEEFRALWASPEAVELADAVAEDAGRLAHRTVITKVAEWKADYNASPAAGAVELPVYRREDGLWAHQKWFIQRAFAAHRAGGARFVLADQVGLGKTVQLALAAKLMALWGDRPVLVLAPRPLLQQWQEELWRLLALPCARWNGRQWIDEQGVVYADKGIDELRRCPRRAGIVSTGLITQGTEAAALLASMQFECVVLDEAHRARRRNIGPTHRNERADPNNLLRFLQRVTPRTRSLLLASATPVQLDPIEAFDLLAVLGEGNDSVLGSSFSHWRTRPREGLDLVLGRKDPPADLSELWEWLRDPLPPGEEHRDVKLLRKALQISDGTAYAKPEDLQRLQPPDRARLQRLGARFFAEHNPYIRAIVRRTRAFLEDTLDPRTQEPYLQPVRVRLFGESTDEAVPLPDLLRDAYEAAEAFCAEVGKRPRISTGFLRTILLRRMGSTIEAGRLTAQKMLGGEAPSDSDEDDDAADEAPAVQPSALHPLTTAEAGELLRLLKLLETGRQDDPKERLVARLLLNGEGGSGPWLEQGCIIFSQYLDSAIWLAAQLSSRLPEEPVALYAGGSASGVYRAGVFTRLDRDLIKAQVRTGDLRLVAGTDAASEGLNLQRLGTLINLDLPWNPTRLEQRKGRIQRIGQVRSEVLIYNMRYRDSVEDRVHQLLSSRLQAIRDLFGQLPDTLEDAWVAVAQHDVVRAQQIIAAVPSVSPFEMKYDRIEPVDWESCAEVLDAAAQETALKRGW